MRNFTDGSKAIERMDHEASRTCVALIEALNSAQAAIDAGEKIDLIAHVETALTAMNGEEKAEQARNLVREAAKLGIKEDDAEMKAMLQKAIGVEQLPRNDAQEELALQT